METIMEKSNRNLYELPYRAIIFSHPRSGLHLLRTGLYLTEGGADSYKEFWPKYNIFYSHEAIPETSTTKHILLLRSYHNLFAKTIYPMILKVYANHIPEKLKSLHPDINIERACDISLSDEDRFGSFAFLPTRYVDLIKQFEVLPDSDKMVIYYEDLIEQEETLHSVAKFIGINKNNIYSFEQIRDKAKEFYVKSNHFPSPPEGTYLNKETHWGLEGCQAEPGHPDPLALRA